MEVAEIEWLALALAHQGVEIHRAKGERWRLHVLGRIFLGIDYIIGLAHDRARNRSGTEYQIADHGMVDFPHGPDIDALPGSVDRVVVNQSDFQWIVMFP